ncbi:MAG TPA: F0F1 ATP synthase subunit A [Acidimicrobiales bacterium]
MHHLLAFEFPPLGELIVWKDLFGTHGWYGLNKVGLECLLATVLTLVIFLMAGRRGALVPTGVQNVAEMVVDFIRDGIILQTMGPEGLGWGMFFTTLFMFIFFCNIFEIVPGIQMPATARMGIPLVLALIAWVCYHVTGIKHQGVLAYFKSATIPPGVPLAMLWLVFFIELLQILVLRPFSLAVRLFANMLAGHLLLVTFAVLTKTVLHPNPLALVTPLTIAMEIAIAGFEILVSLLQAFIFTILTAVYIGGAMHPEH